MFMYNKLRWRNFLLSILISIGLIVPLYVVYINLENKIVSEIKQNAITIARITANIVEENIDEYQKLYWVADHDTDAINQAYYEYMLSRFQEIRKQTNAQYIFTEKQISDSEVVYIIDGEPPESENFSPLGTHDTLDESEEEAFNHNYALASEIIVTDKWGAYITGYAPILDKKTNRVFGLVGVDFSEAYIYGQIKDLRRLFYVIYMLLAGLVVYFVNNVIHHYQEINARDYLTGVHNRMSLDKHLREAVKRHKNKPISVAIIDIDEFKKINDTYGHIYGDQIIKRVAEHIVHISRASDVVTRYGGDEFVIIFNHTALEDAKHICNQLIATINPVRVYDNSDQVQNVTLSIGLTSQNCADGSCDKILQNADEALLLAKRQGKNCCTVYGAE